MKRLVLLVPAVALVLAGCSTTPGGSQTASPPTSPVAQADFLAAHDLEGMKGRQIVDHLDRMAVADRPTDLMASVRAEQLLLADSEQEIVVPLEEDGFYLSVAPYVGQTHDCYYHSLTTCRGELANEDVSVRIVDDSGEVLVDEQLTTFDNGFVGFWLPARSRAASKSRTRGVPARAPSPPAKKGPPA